MIDMNNWMICIVGLLVCWYFCVSIFLWMGLAAVFPLLLLTLFLHKTSPKKWSILFLLGCTISGGTLLAGGDLKVIERNGRMRLVTNLYPLFPMVEVEADSIRLFPPLTVSYYLTDIPYRVEAERNSSFFWTSHQGKISVGSYHPFSRRKILFTEADSCHVISRYYFPYGCIQGFAYYRDGKLYEVDGKGYDMRTVRYIPMLDDGYTDYITPY